MNQEKLEKNYLMNTVQKTAKILRSFTREEPKLSLTDLHKKTGIGVSSLQRFVATLVYEGFLIRDERTKLYRLGLSLFYLGKLVEQESSLLSLAKPALKQLNDKYNESVSMSILDGNERRCIVNFDSTHLLTARNHVGDTSPLYAGASAKSLLAFLPDEEITDYLDEVKFEMITENTVVDRAQLLVELADIRAQGYAVSRKERIFGACSVSAPIQTDSSTRPVASISVIIPEVRFDDVDLEQLTSDVMAAKREIERLVH